MSLNPLKEQLMEDMKTYLKAKETIKLNFVRMLLSEVKNAEINNRETFTADMGYKAVASYVKKLQKTLEEFKARPDKFALLEQEIAFGQTYLPKSMSDDDLKQQLRHIIENFSGEKAFGSVIRVAMKELQGKADGQKIQQFLKELL